VISCVLNAAKFNKFAKTLPKFFVVLLVLFLSNLLNHIKCLPDKSFAHDPDNTTFLKNLTGNIERKII
jgi:hypothetical protein